MQPTDHREIAERIDTLVAEVAADLRQELGFALATFRVGNLPGTIMTLNRLVEGDTGLLSLIAAAAGHRVRETVFEKQIDEVARAGHMPSEIAMDLHWVRNRVNKARHNSAKAELTPDDAATGFGRVLRVMEWYYVTCPGGPRLPTLYTRVPPSRLREYAVRMLGWPRLIGIDRFSVELSARLDSDRLPLAELLRDRQRLVLIGSPGGGKTVCLMKSFKALCQQLAEGPRADSPAVPPVVPIYAELAQLAAGGTLVELIASRLGFSAADALPAFREVLRRASVVLFLDGLNELAEPDRYPCAQQLVALHHRLRTDRLDENLKVVVTTRRYGFSQRLAACLTEEGYLQAEVLPLTADEIGQHLRDRLPGPPERAGELFAALGPKLRHLLSNPQHLSYALEWYTDHAGDADPARNPLRTRGALLDHCIRKRVRSLPRDDVIPLAEDMLRRLAYDGNNAAVYYTQPALLAAAEAALKSSVVSVGPRELVHELREAELLLPSDDQRQFRFPHHSHQQYFAACEMRQRWRAERETYLGSELWHEPLVIMAGLLDDREANRLLDDIPSHSQLYAYILANIDQPERERQFQEAAVRRFSGHVRFWARGSGWLLAGLFLGWFLLLPAWAYALAVHSPPPGVASLAVDALALLFLFGAPVGLRAAYRRWFAARTVALRDRRLPRLLGMLRYLDAQGALRQVRAELGTLLERLAFREGDPSREFLETAARQIDETLDAPSFMTEDEMLDRIADPLVAARIDVEQLTDRGVERLVEQAEASDDSPKGMRALALLVELYGKRPEHRPLLVQVFVGLATKPRSSRARQWQAAAICRRFGIAEREQVPPPPGLLSRVLDYLLRLVGLRR